MQSVTLLDILVHTPPWVWGIFSLLVGFGLLFTRTRRTPLRRAVALPLAITSLSLYGTFSVFHASPVALVVWGSAALLSAAWFATSELPAGVHYDPTTRVVVQPGSWTPLAVMMFLFMVRYSTAVTMAIHPGWARQEGVAAIAASLYGAFSGVFLGRSLRLLRVTRRADRQPAGQQSSSIAWG